MSLNWFDFAIIAVIGLSVLISLFRGFLRETISLVTWIAAIIVGIRFMPQVSDWFKASIASPGLRNVLAFIALFLAVFILGTIVGVIIKRCVDATGFSIVDRLLGGVFGAARGVLLVAVLLIFLSMTQYQNSDMILNSRIVPIAMPFNGWLKQFFPAQLEQVKQWMTQDKTSSKDVVSKDKNLQTKSTR